MATSGQTLTNSDPLSGYACVGAAKCQYVWDVKPSCEAKTCSSPPPGKKYHEGDGIASNTYYSPGESPGLGSCGGCQWPARTSSKPSEACPTCSTGGSYEGLYDIIQGNVGKDWTLAATSEAMMKPYCGQQGAPPIGKIHVGFGCTGRTEPEGPTANAPCGSCWSLTQESAAIGGYTSVNVYVADACPCGNTDVCPNTAGGGSDNSPHCLADPGAKNSRGAYNHFDIWNGNKLGFSDDGIITFKSIECPLMMRQIMRQACCGIYWTGQGCPNICGSDYGCPE